MHSNVIKARGLSMQQINEIFEQAKEGRIDLITKMEKTIPAPRDEISDFAPGMETIKIDQRNTRCGRRFSFGSYLRHSW